MDIDGYKTTVSVLFLFNYNHGTNYDKRSKLKGNNNGLKKTVSFICFVLFSQLHNPLNYNNAVYFTTNVYPTTVYMPTNLLIERL